MKSKGRPAFNAQAFLDSAGVARKVVQFQIKATIFAQGDPAKTVMYIQKGRVKLSVVNATGKRLTIQGALDRMRPKLRSDKESSGSTVPPGSKRQPKMISRFRFGFLSAQEYSK
jgi:CRP-like cAMP-binding protein